MALLTDIGVEELAHLEMIGCIVTQLTKGEGAKSFDKWGRGDYYVDHADAVFPASAAGSPWTAAYIQSKGDPLFKWYDFLFHTSITPPNTGYDFFVFVFGIILSIKS